MKKTVSFLILLALSISLFSCAKAPAQNEQQEPLDKAPPCDVTIDEPFSDFEVVVSFTLEESAKNKEYTPSDFPRLDIFNVFEFNYYPEKYHPEYAGRKTVIISLNSPSKDRVLEYVDVLQKDDRVYSAEPCFLCDFNVDHANAVFKLTDDEISKSKEYTKEDFNYADIAYISKVDETKLKIGYTLDDFETLKKLAADSRFCGYEKYFENPDLETIYVIMKQQKEYTAKDFEYLNLEKVENEFTVLAMPKLFLSKHGYREKFSAYHKLIKDDRVKDVELLSVGKVSP